MLTNDIVSFEQLGPGFQLFVTHSAVFRRNKQYKNGGHLIFWQVWLG